MTEYFTNLMLLLNDYILAGITHRLSVNAVCGAFEAIGLAVDSTLLAALGAYANVAVDGDVIEYWQLLTKLRSAMARATTAAESGTHVSFTEIDTLAATVLSPGSSSSSSRAVLQTAERMSALESSFGPMTVGELGLGAESSSSFARAAPLDRSTAALEVDMMTSATKVCECVL